MYLRKIKCEGVDRYHVAQETISRKKKIWVSQQVNF
jgi:hypothetical protein